MKRSYIARRFQSSGAGLSLDTEALAKYKDTSPNFPLRAPRVTFI